VPVTITGAKGVEGVIESVKNGEADIGFVAYDPVRAAQVDFSQNYALAQNTYLVPENSPIRSVADADRAGVRIGVGLNDAGDHFLTRTLKHAELKRNAGGIGDAAVKLLLAGELEAYAGNRMRLHAVAQEDARACGSCRTISTASSRRSSCRRAMRARLAIVERVHR
jgi:polar amino acid transport system substrate-binding protein